MSYTIRALTVKELPKCEVFGQQFMAEKAIPGTFNLEQFVKNWTVFLTQYKAVIFGLFEGETLVGGIGGMISPDLNTGEECATEFFWYVRPEDRGGTWPVRLVMRFKQWAIDRGARRWRMIHMLLPEEDPGTVKLAGFYEKLGLRPMEVCFDAPLKEGD